MSPAAATSDPILVVDDDPEIRELVADGLADQGYRVIGVRDGREALRVLGHARPGLVILDLNMPVMDGWELRQHMRARSEWADIPVLVLSAYDRMPFELDAVASIKKPFEWPALLRLVKQCARPRFSASGRA